MKNRLHTLLDEYILTAKKFFPELDFSSLFSIHGGKEPLSGRFEFGNQDKAIKNSSYGFKATDTFIHYTSIDSLFNILNSTNLRLYNLNNLNDPTELRFALLKTGITKDMIDIPFYQRSMFLTSFCSYDKERQNEDYNMWRLYGNDGNGVGLVFQIENASDKWNDVYFGKVHYGESNTTFENLKAFLSFHQKFNDEHKILENFPHWIPVMCMLHKSEIWRIENEYRLFAFCPFDEYTFDSSPDIKNTLMYNDIDHCINGKGVKTAYTSIPLNIEGKRQEFNQKLKHIKGGAESLLSSFPHFKLRHILLGYNLNNNLCFDISEYASFIAEKKLGYTIQVEDSIFKRMLEPK
jgi:hypothetical protein